MFQFNLLLGLRLVPSVELGFPRSEVRTVRCLFQQRKNNKFGQSDSHSEEKETGGHRPKAHQNTDQRSMVYRASHVLTNTHQNGAIRVREGRAGGCRCYTEELFLHSEDLNKEHRSRTQSVAHGLSRRHAECCNCQPYGCELHSNTYDTEVQGSTIMVKEKKNIYTYHVHQQNLEKSV